MQSNAGTPATRKWTIKVYAIHARLYNASAWCGNYMFNLEGRTADEAVALVKKVIDEGGTVHREG